MTKICSSHSLFLLFILIVLTTSGCSTLIKGPVASVEDVRIVAMDFESVNLAFDVKVENRNNASVELLGFNYDFKVNQKPFLQGTQENPQKFEALETRNFEVPLKIQYLNLWNTFQELKNKEDFDYLIQFMMDFNLPLIGKSKLGLKHEGKLPSPRLPTLSVQKLELDKINFTSANLALHLEVLNPNSFAFTLNELNYEFSVQNQNWIQGIIRESKQIAPNGKLALIIPIQLNFFQIGKSVYTLLTSDKELNYKFSGNLNFDVSLAYFKKEILIPLKTSGSIQLSKN